MSKTSNGILSGADNEYHKKEEKSSPVNADLIMIEDSADGYKKKRAQVGNLPSAGGGESNTISNVGSAGAGLADGKVGVDLQVRKLNSTTDRIGIVEDAPNKKVDVTLNEGNIVHQNLSGKGTKTHSEIDTHIDDTTGNPHSVDKSDVGLANVTNDAQLKRSDNDWSAISEKTSPHNDDVILIEDSEATGAKKKIKFSKTKGSGGEATRYFCVEPNADYGDYRTRSLGSTGAHRFSFQVPGDFSSLTSLELIGIPTNDITSEDIDMDSDYAGEGENYQQHSETDQSKTFSATADQISKFDISSVFSSLSAKDVCGLFWNHKSIGATVRYLAIKMVYTKV